MAADEPDAPDKEGAKNQDGVSAVGQKVSSPWHDLNHATLGGVLSVLLAVAGVYLALRAHHGGWIGILLSLLAVVISFFSGFSAFGFSYYPALGLKVPSGEESQKRWKALMGLTMVLVVVTGGTCTTASGVAIWNLGRSIIGLIWGGG